MEDAETENQNALKTICPFAINPIELKAWNIKNTVLKGCKLQKGADVFRGKKTYMQCPEKVYTDYGECPLYKHQKGETA